MDSTEIRVYGEQEQSAYNGHFESTCYHPLLLDESHLTRRLFGSRLRRIAALQLPMG